LREDSGVPTKRRRALSPTKKTEGIVTEVFVDKIETFTDRECRLVSQDGAEVGVFRIGDEYFAWHNACAHQGGPVCQGRIFPRVLQPLGEDKTIDKMVYSEEELHIVCPWHGYEYDIRTGRNAGNPRLRLKPAPVVVRDGAVYVQL
jgi:nitrite reductase (NADH) small subunit